jgi:hypothetical protein
MAADDQASHDPGPADDAAKKPQAPPLGEHEELKRLLTAVLSALPAEVIERLAKSRVCFYAGDDRALHRQPISVEIGGRCFSEELFPSGFVYLNSSQLLQDKSPQESLFLVARKLAEVLLWRQRDSVQPTLRDFELAAEELARTWGFDRPRVSLLGKIRNAIGLCSLL